MSISSYLEFGELGFLFLGAFIVIGVLGLVFGGDSLTKGAVHIAKAFSISPIVIGLTIVSIATSMPEMVASIVSSSRGNGGLAVGNILGSNLANSGLIIGISTLICPIVIASRLVKIEVPFMIAVTALAYFFARGGTIDHLEGIILVVLTILYLLFLVRTSKAGDAVLETEVEEEVLAGSMSVGKASFYVLGGALLLALGADFLVSASVEVATRWGVSDFIIGVTVVAIGTSLPELAACVSSAYHKQADLIAGNVVGSNIFNLLLIGGVSSSFFGLPIESSQMAFDFPMLLVMSALLFWFFFTKSTVSRLEGMVLLFVYTGAIIFSVYSSL